MFDAFDCQGADDFVIPAAASWSITGATFVGTYYDVESGLRIRISGSGTQ